MKKKKKLIVILILIIVALFIYKKFINNNGVIISSTNSTKNDQESIDWTINFLKKQESQDLNEVEKEINKVNKDTAVSKFDMTKAKKRFGDVIFLGDSITEYLRESGILDAASVLAKKGEHVSQGINHISVIKNLKPKQVVLFYGANDILAYSPENFKAQYINLINNIKKVDPNVKIYVQAPVQVNEEIATKKDARLNNDNVKNYAKKAKEACSATGARYLSSDGLVSSNDLFEQDGIHFKYGFYKNWLYFLSQNI